MRAEQQQEEEEEAPLIIQRLHNIQHNGLRDREPKHVSFTKGQKGSRRRSSFLPGGRKQSGGPEAVRMSRGPELKTAGADSPPPIRSYQQDLVQFLLARDEQPKVPPPLTRRASRLTREEKKAGGWAMPNPTQNRSKLANALHLFLVNLSRPTDQRNQVPLLLTTDY
jgi:hypothetical protein